jgi:hypothetical protein
MPNKISKAQYYTVTLQKGLNLLIDADRCTKTFSETVKEMAEKYSTENWDVSPIADYMDAYLNAKVLKDFLQKKIQSPDEELVRFATKNKIDGILLTKNELTMLQTLVNNFEETKEYLQKNYGFSTMLN